MTVGAGNLGRNPFSRCRIAIENSDLRTGCGKGTAGRRPDPIPAAGDEGDSSGKIFGHPLQLRRLQFVAQRRGTRLAQTLPGCEDLTGAGAPR